MRNFQTYEGPQRRPQDSTTHRECSVIEPSRQNIIDVKEPWERGREGQHLDWCENREYTTRHGYLYCKRFEIFSKWWIFKIFKTTWFQDFQGPENKNSFLGIIFFFAMWCNLTFTMYFIVTGSSIDSMMVFFVEKKTYWIRIRKQIITN